MIIATIKQLFVVRKFSYEGIFNIVDCSLFIFREELEKQRAHERYMRLQEQGKTEQARKDLGN